MTHIFTDLNEKSTIDDFRKEYLKFFGVDFFEFTDPEDIPEGLIKNVGPSCISCSHSEDCIELWEDDDQNNVVRYYGDRITLNRFRKTFKIYDDAKFEFLSHINGMKCENPNNWVSCTCIDSDDVFSKDFKAWYYVDDLSIDLDDIDYLRPDFIEDSKNKIVYSN